MIACDTSSLSAFLDGDNGPDIEVLSDALASASLVLPPVVLTEALVNRVTRGPISPIIESLRLIELTEGYWRRAGELRATVLAKKHKARLADTLIAQACIDTAVPLLTRDRDFRHFQAHGLKLAAQLA